MKEQNLHAIVLN